MLLSSEETKIILVGDEDMTENKTLRNANMDVLRILSMLLIILLHSLDEHGGILQVTDAAGWGLEIYGRTLYLMTMVSVNCFVMLTGYFQVNSQFRLYKLVVLWLEVVFYSLLIRIIFILIGIKPFSFKSVLSCFFPIFTGRYWFVTIYFGLYMLSPFLNVAVHAMDRQQHAILNVILILLFSVWISVHPGIAGMNSGRGWGLPWFIVLYLISAWIRLYYKPSGRIIRNIILFIVISLFIGLIYGTLGNKVPMVQVIVSNWYKYDSVPALLLTLILFSIFIMLNIKSNSKSILSWVAMSTFGVYLIHAHADFSPWLWKFVDLPSKVYYPVFPLIHLTVVCLIFGVCSLIEILRRVTLGRIENSDAIIKICDGITSNMLKYLNRSEK